MDDSREPARLQVDLRNPKAPTRKVPRTLRYPALIIGGTVLAVLVAVELGRLPTGAGTALRLGFHWVTALAWLAVAAAAWRMPKWSRSLRDRLLFALLAAAFLVFAVLETRSLS